MRLIKILDQDNITVYLNPRFVQAIAKIEESPIKRVIVHLCDRSFATFDSPSIKRLGEIFDLT